jgi:predicted amidohydrolase
MLKLTAIQLSSLPNVEANLAAISRQLCLLIESSKEAEQKGEQKTEHLVVLPECCLFFGGRDSEQLDLAKQSKKDNDLVNALAAMARQYNVYLVAGTVPLLNDTGEKFTNSSCLFSPHGELLTCYDKIHLFDVVVADREKNYCESRYTQAGDKLSMISADIANVGLSVCFDLRFPLLFQQLTKLGADIITVPSAFTRVTGKAHWQTLLQARAIENQVYIIAAGQEGVHANGRETWGHSMIISPWGEVLACLPQGEGYISVDYQPREVRRIRESMPLKSNLYIS